MEFVQKTVLVDYVWEPRGNVPGVEGSFVIPVTVDDLAANGLLEEDHLQACRERSVETLTARKEEIAGHRLYAAMARSAKHDCSA